MVMQVTKEWATYFRETGRDAHYSSTFEIHLIKEIKGNKGTYIEILNLIDYFFDCFNWLTLVSINLDYTPEFEKYEDLQTFTTGRICSLEVWKQSVIDKVGNLFPMEDNYGLSSTRIYFDYKVEVDKKIEFLCGDRSFHSGYISIYYDDYLDISTLEIGLDIQKEFATNKALDDEGQCLLPTAMAENNLLVLKNSISKLIGTTGKVVNVSDSLIKEILEK